METGTPRTVDIPFEASEEAARRISDYTVAFANLPSDKVDVGLGGSGTLVQVEGKHAILTAAHVVDQLWKAKRFGLVLSGFPSGRPHNLFFETASVKKVQIPRPRHLDESEPPDVAIIELPPNRVGDVLARKSFYNILKHQHEALSGPPNYRLGFWLMSGSSGEWTADASPLPGFKRLVVFNGRVMGVAVTPLETNTEFDGWSGTVVRGEDYDGPESFGGYSGGGLWQNLIEKKCGKIRLTGSLLSGVAYYQSDDCSTIRFSGRKCIYEALLNVMKG